MLTIDADAHVIECEKTWDYLEGERQALPAGGDRRRHAVRARRKIFGSSAGA